MWAGGDGFERECPMALAVGDANPNLIRVPTSEEVGHPAAAGLVKEHTKSHGRFDRTGKDLYETASGH